MAPTQDVQAALHAAAVAAPSNADAGDVSSDGVPCSARTRRQSWSGQQRRRRGRHARRAAVHERLEAAALEGCDAALGAPTASGGGDCSDARLGACLGEGEAGEERAPERAAASEHSLPPPSSPSLRCWQQGASHTPPRLHLWTLEGWANLFRMARHASGVPKLGEAASGAAAAPARSADRPGGASSTEPGRAAGGEHEGTGDRGGDISSSSHSESNNYDNGAATAQAAWHWTGDSLRTLQHGWELTWLLAPANWSMRRWWTDYFGAGQASGPHRALRRDGAVRAASAERASAEQEPSQPSATARPPTSPSAPPSWLVVIGWRRLGERSSSAASQQQQAEEEEEDDGRAVSGGSDDDAQNATLAAATDAVGESAVPAGGGEMDGGETVSSPARYHWRSFGAGINPYRGGSDSDAREPAEEPLDPSAPLLISASPRNRDAYRRAGVERSTPEARDASGRSLIPAWVAAFVPGEMNPPRRAMEHFRRHVIAMQDEWAHRSAQWYRRDGGGDGGNGGSGDNGSGGRDGGGEDELANMGGYSYEDLLRFDERPDSNGYLAQYGGADPWTIERFTSARLYSGGGDDGGTAAAAAAAATAHDDDDDEMLTSMISVRDVPRHVQERQQHREGDHGASVDAAASPPDADHCVICLDAFRIGDSLRILPCLHTYHRMCVDRWLARSKTCPMCKYAIDSGALSWRRRSPPMASVFGDGSIAAAAAVAAAATAHDSYAQGRTDERVPGRRGEDANTAVADEEEEDGEAEEQADASGADAQSAPARLPPQWRVPRGSHSEAGLLFPDEDPTELVETDVSWREWFHSIVLAAAAATTTTTTTTTQKARGDGAT